jgi:hypothetical protein
VERCIAPSIGPPGLGLSSTDAQVGRKRDRYDGNLSGCGQRSCGRNSGGPMELSDRERKLAVLALLVMVLAAGVGTLGAVFSGFSFI